MGTARTLGSAKGARRRRGLMVKDFWLEFDDTLNRVRYKTVLFGFFQNSRHPFQIFGRSNHDPGFKHDLGYLVTTPRHFFEFTVGCRRKAHQWQLGILSDSEKRKHKAGVDRGNKKMFRRPLTFSPFELWRSADTDGWKSGPFYPSFFFFGPLNFCFVIEHSWFGHFSYSFGSIRYHADSVQPLRHVSSHYLIQYLFTVLYSLIHDLQLVGVGHALFNSAMQGTHNFQQMLIELFNVMGGLRHINLRMIYK